MAEEEKELPKMTKLDLSRLTSDIPRLRFKDGVRRLSNGVIPGADIRRVVPEPIDLQAGGDEEGSQSSVRIGTSNSTRWLKVHQALKSVGNIKTQVMTARALGKPVTDEEEVEENTAIKSYKGKKLWFILLPENKGLKFWEVFIGLLLVYVALVVPVRVCFDVEPDPLVETADLVVDALFIIDVILNSITAYVGPDGLLVVSFGMILKHYARGWMFIDLLASIPLYSIVEGFSGSETQANRLSRLARLPRIFRLAKLLRLLKLLRVLRVIRYMKKWEQTLGINVGVSRMMKIALVVCMVTHLIACLWYYLTLFERDSWSVAYGVLDADLYTKYLAAIYWAFSTLTTVGFGDVSANSNIERIFSVVVMVMGVSWYAFIISSISSIVHLFDRRNAKIQRNTSLVLQFMRETKVPWDLRRRILFYVQYAFDEGKSESDLDNVLRLLSNKLQTEVILHLYRKTVVMIPFFENKTPQFVAACVVRLTPWHAYKGETISMRGQHSQEMYFLTKGVAYVVDHDVRRFKLVAGSYFGEIGCLLQEVNKVSVVAGTDCEMYALSKDDLKRLMKDFPDVSIEIRKTANDRMLTFVSSDGSTYTNKISDVEGGSSIEAGNTEAKASDSSMEWITTRLKAQDEQNKLILTKIEDITASLQTVSKTLESITSS